MLQAFNGDNYFLSEFRLMYVLIKKFLRFIKRFYRAITYWANIEYVKKSIINEIVHIYNVLNIVSFTTYLLDSFLKIPKPKDMLIAKTYIIMHI